MSVTIREAAARRAEAAERPANKRDGQARSHDARAAAPDDVRDRRSAPVKAQFRASLVEREGKSYNQLDGFASVYEQTYEMWDWAGPYEEVVSEGAGSASLSQGPDVVYLLNHTGIPFARSISGTLDLSEPGGGLWSEGFLNPKRQDVKDLVEAVSEKSITEMSFAFRITRGQWSPDYMEYRIKEFDIDRGDVSPVTFGANPHTSIDARAARFHLTNDLVRAAKTFDDDDVELLREAIGAREAEPDKPAGLQIGKRAITDLRQLRAETVQGGLDSAARSTLAAIIDDLIDGGRKLSAGDGTLAIVLGLASAEPEPATRSNPVASLSFLERELDSARRL